MNTAIANTGSNRGYKSLCTEFYDLIEPFASRDEIEFYKEKLGNKKTLEAMCGSGRLLIPLLKAGLQVDGIDNSPEMLASCRKRLDKEKLNAALYEQDVNEINLAHLYDVIFIAYGSFQLLHPREYALATLIKLRENLNPGGQIILEMYIPWEALYENGEYDESEREIEIDDHTSLHMRLIYHFDKVHQLIKSYTFYKKIHTGNTLQREEEELYENWYYRYEMIYLLEKAGFQNVTLQDTNFSQHPKGIVYIGEKV